MGARMCQRLAEAHPKAVLLFDADNIVSANLASRITAVACQSCSQIAAAADILFSCVPTNQIVREVYLGEQGVHTAIRPGSITIDCSTVGPDVSREVSEALLTKQVHHLDASMLGSTKQAEEGTISFVVGGNQDAFERAKPALSTCGQLVRYCGPSGAGNQMKLIHQSLVAGHAVAVAEALGLCLETGTDIDAFYEIVTQGTGFAYSRYFENRVPRMREGDFSPLFALKFMLKDAKLALKMVPNGRQNYQALAAVISTLQQAVDNGHAEDDFSAAIKAIEARINKTIVQSPSMS